MTFLNNGTLVCSEIMWHDDGGGYLASHLK